MSSDLDSVKRDVAIANRVLSVAGLASGALASLGHVSMRVPAEPDKFVVKGLVQQADVVHARGAWQNYAYLAGRE
jgi:hypothetical protein